MEAEAIITAESRGIDLRRHIPFWEKSNLTIDEAAAYTVGRQQAPDQTQAAGSVPR